MDESFLRDPSQARSSIGPPSASPIGRSGSDFSADRIHGATVNFDRSMPMGPYYVRRGSGGAASFQDAHMRGGVPSSAQRRGGGGAAPSHLHHPQHHGAPHHAPHQLGAEHRGPHPHVAPSLNAGGPTRYLFRSALSAAPLGSLASALQSVIVGCHDHQLHGTAVWLSDLLLSGTVETLHEDLRYRPMEPLSFASDASYHLYLTAKSLFSNREFVRCHHLLRFTPLGTALSAGGTAAAGGPHSSQQANPEELPGGLQWYEPASEGIGETSIKRGTLFDDTLMSPPPATLHGGGGGAPSDAEPHQPPPQPLPTPSSGADPFHMPQNGEHTLSSPLVFLCLYALYLHQQAPSGVTAVGSGGMLLPPPSQHAHRPGAHQQSMGATAQLRNLRSMLLQAKEYFPGDVFIGWLHGVVLRDLGLKQDAAGQLVDVLRECPYLWCAWEDLLTVVTREAQLEEIGLRVGISQHADAELMFRMFAAVAKSEVFAPSTSGGASFAPSSANQKDEVDTAAPRTQAGGPPPVADNDPRSPYSPGDPHRATRGAASLPSRSSLTGSNSKPSSSMFPPAATATATALGPYADASYESLLAAFPHSAMLRTHWAKLFSHFKMLSQSQEQFAWSRQVDPHRLEGMDDYSNVLFVLGDRVGLCSLAQACYAVDPYSAEANFVAGNYFYLLGKHERSLLHFKRAVALNPRCLSAWTLMGHCYIELKNIPASVEAYRAATEMDQRDYRAWYGLGQVYELLQMNQHALYYYQTTTTLRPTDPRMWTAVANCLDKERRRGEAIVCLERAETFESPHSPHYTALVRRIAMYHLLVNQRHRAILFLEKLLEAPQKSVSDALWALPRLIDSHLRLVQAQSLVSSQQQFTPQQQLQGGAGGGPSSVVLPPQEDIRRVDATQRLQLCEEYIAMWRTVLSDQGTRWLQGDDGHSLLSGVAQGGGAVEGAASMAMLQRSQQEILAVKQQLLGGGNSGAGGAFRPSQQA